MTDNFLIIVTIVVLFTILTIGTKVAWALGISGLLVILTLFGTSGLRMIGLIAWDKGTAFTLTCMPLFIFMGEMVMRSGMNKVVFDGMERLMKGIPGGVLQTTVGTCAAFAAASGSSVAAAGTVASVAYPELIKRGYSPRLSAGTIAAGGTLAVMIPPSMQLVIYGSVVEESISKLFIAGIVPGLMLSTMFCTYIAVAALMHPKDFPPREKGGLRHNLFGIVMMWPVAVLVVLVTVVMFAGIATPTEAAALGAVGSMFMTLIFRKHEFLKALHEASLATLSTTGMIMFLIIGATILTFTMTHLRVTELIIEGIIGYGISPLAVFIGIVLVYTMLGMFLDAVSMMVLTLPIFHPLLMRLGFDSVWFGVIVVLNLEIAFITPPVGFGLYILSGVSGRPIDEVIRGVIPFICILFVGIAIVYAFPDIPLWLVRMM